MAAASLGATESATHWHAPEHKRAHISTGTRGCPLARGHAKAHKQVVLGHAMRARAVGWPRHKSRFAQQGR
eukprot:15435743-Alexandrium_andersonii.AAC.1